MQIANLFADTTAPERGERFATLLAHRNLVVERIVSSDVLAAQEFFQPQDEWVVLLRGDATLEVTGETVPLRAGDYLFLPAHTRHKVLRASKGALWLAVHLHPQDAVRG
jgi:cupin 2 domain-containing protein